MAVEWFLHDGSTQQGPIDEATLAQRLSTYQNLKGVLVWRAGFENWKPASEVFGSLPSTAAVAPQEMLQAPTNVVAHATLEPRRRVKGRAALYGALFGALILLADIVFEWRGNVLLPWVGYDIVHNISYIVTSVGIPSLLFFIVGSIIDLSRRPKAVPNSADRDKLAASLAAMQAPRKYNNFIAKNWRGEYRLWVSYWVFGFLGNIAILVVVATLTAIFRSRAFNPLYVFILIAAIWIVVPAMALWLWVGIWRAANRYKIEHALANKRAGWAAVAKIMVVLGVLQMAAAIVKTGIPQLTEATQIAFFDDPRIPDYVIRVMRGGTEAEITGGIKYGLTRDFAAALSASPGIRVVHLNSPGGRIGEGLGLYDLIKSKGMDTYVSGSCLSACTVAFSAGRQRVLNQGAELGFHRGSFAGEEIDDTDGQRRIFVAAGYDPAFITRALSTPNSSMWKPTPKELLDAGVIGRVSDGSDFAFSGFGADFSKASVSKMLLKTTGLYTAISEHQPEAFNDIVAGFYDAVQEGKTEPETRQAIQEKLSELILTLREHAGDDVMLDFGRLIVDQLSALQARSGTSCYLYAAKGEVDAKAFPEPLLKRELELKERIIRTAKVAEVGEPSDAQWDKVMNRVYATGVTKDDVEMLTQADLTGAQQQRYCPTAIALYREILASPKPDSVVLMRAMLRS